MKQKFEEAKKHLEYNFIRNYKKNYFDIKEYITKSGNIVYFDHADEPDDEECVYIGNEKDIFGIFICPNRFIKQNKMYDLNLYN